MASEYLSRQDKPKLAYAYTPAGPEGEDYPLVMFLGGFRSDMSGTKATYFEQQCHQRGQAYLRFDYSGHGQSDGKFEQGTIGSWKEDALDVLDHITKGPVVLVGSSMGGWVALLVALARSGAVQGVVGIAAAPDFTQDLYENHFTPDQLNELEEKGFVEVPNDYSDEPYIYTRTLIEEGRVHCLLDKELKIDIPVRLIQGVQDPVVSWKTAMEIEKALKGAEVDVILIEDGDHSLSRPEDLTLIDKEIQSLSRVLNPMQKSA